MTTSRAIGIRALVLAGCIAIGFVFFLLVQTLRMPAEFETIRPTRDDASDMFIPVTTEPGPPQDTGPRKPASVESSGRVILAILEPDGSPGAHAHSAIWQGRELVWKGCTDEAGEILLDSDVTGSATVLVLASDSIPQIHAIELARGRQEVRLSLGSVLSGRLTVNGQVPQYVLPLELRSDHPLLMIEEIGTSWQALGLDPRRATTIGSRTSPEGAFRFYGLPSDWRGSLRLPRNLRPSDAAISSDVPNSVLFAQPAEDLWIDLMRLLRMRGRIVATPGGKPVPGAIVRPGLAYPDDVSMPAWQGFEIADAQGRFEFVLLSSSIRGGSLEIAAPDDLLTRRVTVDAEDLIADKDLGDLPLVEAGTSAELHLLVVDTSGSPIVGAVAGMDNESPASMRTDEGGRTVLRGVTPGVSVLEVHALGFESADVPVPRELPAELLVTMKRGTLLKLALRQQSGEAAFAGFILSAEEYPFVKPLRSVRAYMSAGPTIFTSQDPDGGVAINFHVDRKGRATLNGIKPGLPLKLTVIERFGETLIDAQAVLPLQEEEHREIDIILPRSPRDLQGCVLDENGRPLADAKIKYMTYLGGKRSGLPAAVDTIQSDETGKFEIKQIYVETIDLAISKDDYVPFRDAHFSVPAEKTIVEFHLSLGRQVKVTVEAADGQLVEAVVIARFAQDGRIIGSKLGQGTYLLRGVPDESVTITARVYDTPYTIVHHSGSDEARIQLPMLGVVAVHINLLLDAGEPGRVVLTLVPEAESKLFLRREVIDLSTNEWPIPLTLHGVLAGNYTAVVQRAPSQYTWRDIRDISTLQHVRVNSGETTHVHIYP